MSGMARPASGSRNAATTHLNATDTVVTFSLEFNLVMPQGSRRL